MQRSCRYCGGIHPVGRMCKPRRAKIRTEANRVRSTRGWTVTAKSVKARDCYLCLVCLSEGRVTYDQLEAHHIIPISERPDLALDERNCITLCVACHKLADAGVISRDRLRELVYKPPPYQPTPHL